MPDTGAVVVAVAQLALTVGEPDANRQAAGEAVARAAAAGARPAVLTAAIDLRLARDKRNSELNDLFADRRPALYARLRDAAGP